MERVKNLQHRFEEPEPFSPEERELILANLPEQSRNLFQFTFRTGLRTSELIALEWGDVRSWLVPGNQLQLLTEATCSAMAMREASDE